MEIQAAQLVGLPTSRRVVRFLWRKLSIQRQPQLCGETPEDLGTKLVAARMRVSAFDETYQLSRRLLCCQIDSVVR